MRSSAGIPLLCRKAGVRREDVRGAITGHRARATIATQLYNAKDPMSLFELQAWLGRLDSDRLVRSVGLANSGRRARRAMALERRGHSLDLDPELGQQRHRVAVLGNREQHVRELDMRPAALDRQLRGSDEHAAQLARRTEVSHTPKVGSFTSAIHPRRSVHDAQHLSLHATGRDTESFEQR